MQSARSWRFLLTRRWLGLLLVTVLLAALSWRLGVWQFHRLAERKAANAVVERHLHMDPEAVERVLAVDRPVGDDQEWTRVTATGAYDAADTVVIRYQSRDGNLGADLVTPLVTAAGPDLLVNRGWIATPDRTPDLASLPAPPAGQVTIVGWVRGDGTGDSVEVSDRSARAVSSVAISDALGLTTYGGWVALDSETPAASTTLAATQLPDESNGPHFFYGLQWWFFALLAVFGYLYLAYDEWRGGGAARRLGHRTGRVPSTTAPAG